EALGCVSRSEPGFGWAIECYEGQPMLTRTTWGRRLLHKGAWRSYLRSGFTDTRWSPQERERCLVTQDVAVKLERLAEGIEWVQQHLGVYPLGNCAIKLSDEDAARF